MARIAAAASPAQTSGLREGFETGNAITRPVSSGSSAACTGTGAGFEDRFGSSVSGAGRFGLDGPAALPRDLAADLPVFPDFPLPGAPLPGDRPAADPCAAFDTEGAEAGVATGLATAAVEGASPASGEAAAALSVPAVAGTGSDPRVSSCASPPADALPEDSASGVSAAAPPATGAASAAPIAGALLSGGDTGVSLVGSAPAPHVPSPAENAGAAGARAAAASPASSSTSHAARIFDA
jgi:hypothetical protein